MRNKLGIIWHVLLGHGVIYRTDIRRSAVGWIDIWPHRSGGSVHIAEANLEGAEP